MLVLKSDMQVIIMCIVAFLISIEANDKCLSGSQASPDYELVKKCHRSKLSVAAKGRYAKLSSCKRFALDKKALSLNFSPSIAEKKKRLRLGDTCEVLQCAETNATLNLANDSRYDYYSLFGNSLPEVNSTCVPGIGVFYLIKTGINYTEAKNMCLNKSSVLADVASERRTDAIAQLLTDVSINYAYVGLRRFDNDFVTINGDGLECTEYRAWAPGHPKRRSKADCMVITKNGTWKTVPCQERIPALCELLPGIELPTALKLPQH